MDGTLDIPPPWLNGVHGSLSDGVRAFEAAVRIKESPFPFMYIQLHYLIDLFVLVFTPLLMSSYFKDIAFGVAMTMLVVFSSHSLFTALVNLHCDFIDKLRQLVDHDVADALEDQQLENKGTSESSLHLGRFIVADLSPHRAALSRFRFDVISEIRSRARAFAKGEIGSRSASRASSVAISFSPDGRTIPERAKK
eukprot:Polyplicarium_translucidae@DN2515_c0_g1_i2.p1